MKVFRFVGGFIIFYFVLTVTDRIGELGQWISQGNKGIEYGFYGFLLLMGVYFLVLPLFVFTRKPSMGTLAKLAHNDVKASKRVYKYYLKHSKGELKESLANIQQDDLEGIKQWARVYLEQKSIELDQKIRNHALRLTATVMVSPNPFIDGIAVLFGNSRMLYELTNHVDIRYRWTDIMGIYFDNFAISAATGIIQEFDDEIEEVFESLLEEFDEFLEEQAGVSIGESIPFVNLFVRASVPIIQAAGNYGYVVFSGNKFKLTLLNCMEEVPLEKGQLRKKARKIARKARYGYIKDMFAQIGSRSTNKMKKTLFRRKKNEERELL